MLAASRLSFARTNTSAAADMATSPINHLDAAVFRRSLTSLVRDGR